jgi:hypothetical protein
MTAWFCAQLAAMPAAGSRAAAGSDAGRPVDPDHVVGVMGELLQHECRAAHREREKDPEAPTLFFDGARESSTLREGEDEALGADSVQPSDEERESRVSYRMASRERASSDSRSRSLKGRSTWRHALARPSQ